jgi:hypothetical protein
MWHPTLPVFIVVMETQSLHLSFTLSTLYSSTLSPAAYVVKMLPFSILFLLLFSATILAPSPHLMIGLIRTASLQSFTWSTLPTSNPSSVSLSRLVAVPELPILVPRIPLNASPTSFGPGPMHVVLSSTTIPYSLVNSIEDRLTNTTALLVVLLAMFICFVCSPYDLSSSH